MANHLKDETSPYLLQHSENPIEWYPWCNEAFERALKEDKPVFLSIGYSTCHWCHVMAHESFENPEIAKLLNRAFICVKVDREERPDIDNVYMSVCQALTGSGGWPMSIFMTWDKKPFFAGNYFPPESRYGAIGFPELLKAVERQWRSNRDRLLQSSDKIIAHLRNNPASQTEKDGGALIQNAVQWFKINFDSVFGGFGAAPKFPTPHNLLFLLLYHSRTNDALALEMVEKTLIQMRKGGIYDHIGGGFSRYSTDPAFLVPHFEKMLYDNAWLIIAYSAAFHVTENPVYLDTARHTADYVLREMTSKHGGFYSAQDADSEGVEGRYYTFTLHEVLEVLGNEKGRRFAQAFDITSKGNFEGANIPNLLKSENFDSDFSQEKTNLLNYREKRVELHLDDKILTAWNAMMISAMCMLYRACGDEKYLQAALNAQEFIKDNLQHELCLYTSFRNDKRSEQGFLDDYAYEIAALIELYHSSFEPSFIEHAEVLCMETVRRFSDTDEGGCFMSDNSELFMNPKETYDGAVPSGNAVMAYNFVRLYQLTEREIYKELAEKQLHFLTEHTEVPAGHSMFLLAKLIYDEPPKHITFVWKDPEELNELKSHPPFWANVSAFPEGREHPLLNDMATAYVCEGHICHPPINPFYTQRQ